LDVTIAQNLFENDTNKLIGSMLLPYQCFLQTLPSYYCYDVCDIFLVFCCKCWLFVLIWQRQKTFLELCTVPVAAYPVPISASNMAACHCHSIQNVPGPRFKMVL